MQDVDQVFIDQIENDKFQSIMNDDLSFADSLIDQRDIDRVFNNKEDNTNGNN